MFRKRLLISVLLLSILTAGCDSLITGFRAGVAASKPVIQSLVVSGTISQAKADTATRDLDDGLNFGATADTCVKAASGDKNQKRVAKAKCYFALAQGLRVVLARHNLSGTKTLDQVAVFIQGAIEAFEIYHAAVTGTGDGAVDGEAADAQLERAMERLNNRLKAIKVRCRNSVTGQFASMGYCKANPSISTVETY